MDLGLIVSIIGVVVAIVGIVATYLFAPSAEKKKEIRTAAKIPLIKLTNEISLMEEGTYPNITIRDSDFNELLSLLTERKSTELKKLIKQYKAAHNETAKIQHYHDTKPSNSIVFLNAFDILNPKETIEQLRPLLKFLKKL
ncbi:MULTISPECIES: hypothetical protein [Providencia]|uniref:hypothetical protein n=2 Tax=Providencia TaxID=586 RepID=UPI001EE7579C|nr:MULTISPECIES: hypothetical protein [Providencia]MCG5368687.1 hypothetical protein [Providencia rettgeri]MCX9110608.1 hypothetical protein [Providencia rettgeri]